MKARKNSIHAMIYKFTYKSDLPNNLCPYFWKVILGIILFIPNFIIQFPILLIQLFQKDKDDVNVNEKRLYGFIIYGILFLIFVLFSSNYNIIQAFLHHKYNVDAVAVGCILDFGIVLEFFKYLGRKIINKKYRTIEPKIDWE